MGSGSWYLRLMWEAVLTTAFGGMGGERPPACRARRGRKHQIQRAKAPRPPPRDSRSWGLARPPRREGERLWQGCHGRVPVARGPTGWPRPRAGAPGSAVPVKALVWFWLIDETLSANLVYQSDYKIGSTTPRDEAMAKIMTMVMAW